MKKKLKSDRSILLLFILSTSINFAQPVIKVPASCEVVFAGAGVGVSTGFGGIVGDGGIVIMADPFDFEGTEGDFYYVANDSNLIQWKLLGDLSMQTDSNYNEILQPVGSVNPINLQSYNKNLRDTTTTTAISCNAVTGATGYSWDLSGAPGWSIFANGTTNNPTFTPNGSTAGPVTIKVTALGATGASCDGNASAAYTVTYAPVAPTISAITCWNSSVPATGALIMPAKTLTITNFQTFGTYTVDANAALFSGFTVNTTTGVITLNNPVFLNTGSYSFVLRHASGTCTDATTTITITVAAVTVTTPLTAVSGFTASGIVDNYLHTSGAGGVTFASWFVNNAPVISGGNVGIISNQLSLAGATAPTSVGIYVNDNTCFKRVYSPNVGTRGARMSNPNTRPIKGISISPNPNNGSFTITVLDFKDSATAILFDMNGRVITTAVLSKGENKIEKTGLAKGTYIVSLLVDGQPEARQIIIQ